MEDFTFNEQKDVSLRHKITDDIRKAIFRGRLKPGSRLREIEMSRQMGVSRGPIREAMRMLEQEGLLYSLPYKETMVAEITGEEVAEVLIPLRLTIELYTVRKALAFMNDEHIGRLRAIIDDMRDGAAKQDATALADCDLAFHEYLVTLSGMGNMIGIWKSIYNRIRLHFITQANAYEDLNVLCQEHENLLGVITDGDQAQIAEALTAHIHAVNFGIMKQS
ncbi:GntR family transcriptional regulator [Paenibacillus agaridevorans]|uniref:GntR family transcriptional regulator n=1 Tax=Paenibacillus agaridevorans TaxID=171404 RepID=UPI001BE48A0C|nr:GntR family transcriptional regulator [Paenibacillus agaridevorans]